MQLCTNRHAAAIQAHTFTISDVSIVAPTMRSILSILIFIIASGLQHDCHAYLASLKSGPQGVNKTSTSGPSDYKLPEHPAFANCIAPHYTAECQIYLSMAVFAAPRGEWLNGTLICALVFVVVNLGVTADGTKVWYERQFGKQAVEGKSRMLPYIW